MSITDNLSKIKALLDQAFDLKFIDPPRVTQLGLEALNQSRQLGHRLYEAQSLCHLAWGELQSGLYRSSAAHALEAVFIAQEIRDRETEARAVGLVAVNFAAAHDFQSAFQLFEFQRDIAREIHHDELYALALNDLGILKMETGDFDTSQILFEEALGVMPTDIMLGCGNALIHANLGYLAVSRGNAEDGFVHAQIAFEKFRTAQANDWVMYSLIMLTLACLVEGDFDRAEAYVAQMHHLATDGISSASAVNMLRIDGEVHLKRGNLAEAREAFIQAREFARKNEIVWSEAAIVSRLIDVHKLQEQFEAAFLYSDDLHKITDFARKKDANWRLTVLQAIYENRRALDERLLEQSGIGQNSAGEIALHDTRTDEIKAREDSEMKARILNRLNHEFRTPLTIIQSGADLLGHFHDRLTGEQRQKQVGKILYQVAWMTTMLDDILNLLRFTRQERKLERTSVQVPELVEQILKQLNAYHLEAERVDVTITGAEVLAGVDMQAAGDILRHLLLNGLKYSKDVVHLRCAVQPEQVVIQVQDKGIGIPPDEQTQVVEPFIRGSNIGEITGNGLGLAIIDQCVKLHGGTLSINSQLGQGTTVEVVLPYADVG